MSITKKRLFGILLSLAMAMGLMLAMSQAAWADTDTTYPLWVGGVQVTSANKDDVLGEADGIGATVRFAPATTGENATPATLTLSGANITTGCFDSTSWFYGGIIYEGSTPLTIELASGTKNTVDVSKTDKVRNCGIYCFDKDDSSVNLTITGEGSMTAKGKFTGITASDITINNGVVEAKAVDESAIRVTNSVTINGGTVTASGHTIGIIGIYDKNNKVITISGGKVTATGSVTAIDGIIVKNAIAGTGWTDVAGTTGETAIAVSSEGQTLSGYKKVQFPAAPHTHTVGEGASAQTITFKPWTDELAKEQRGSEATAANSLPKNEGSYYLTKDVTISDQWQPSGEFNLCLNGHSITLDRESGEKPVIYLLSGATLNLFDEEANAGTITHATGEGKMGGRGVYVNGGIFNMYGGAITGNNNVNGYGTGVYVNGTFNMYGGTITGNSTSTNGGGVYVQNGTFAISGSSTITGNVKGGTYDAESGTYVKGENGTGTDNNVYLASGKVITVADALTNTTPIGVTMQTPGVFTSSTDPIKASGYIKLFASDDENCSIKAVGDELRIAQPEITYIDPTAETKEKTIDDYTVVSSNTTLWGKNDSETWYVVNAAAADNLTISNRITVYGTVNLILCDGAKLTANNGIDVAAGYQATATLNIYGQTKGDGTLIATGGSTGNAGIGSGEASDSGNVTVYGGTVNATGGSIGGAGIGGGSKGYDGNVTIHGGNVIATGGEGAVGIGAGKDMRSKADLNLGTGVGMLVSNDNSNWSAYDGSTRARYMMTHTHSFTYSANGATITATCSAEGCPLPPSTTGGSDHVVTLIIAAPESLAYDGNPKAATITDENSIQGDAKVMYQKKTGESSYDTETETAPTDAGTYKASITLGEGDGAKTASVEYTITATPLTITGATLTSRDYVKDKKDVGVTAVTFSGGSPTINTDFTATAEMTDDTAGDSKDVTVTVTLSNTNYSLAANTYQTTVKITKATPKAPDAPTAASKTDTSVTLTATNGYQYKCGNNGTWQDSPEFTGLEECKSYVFFQRVKEDSNHNNSDSSGGTTVNTAVKYTKYSRSGNIILIEIKQVDDYIPAENSNKTIWLKDEDFYVVKGDVMLSKGLVYSGNVSILLCDNSKLTIKGGIWHYGSELTIYGQNGQSEEIIVTGDKTITPDEVPAGATISTDSALDGGTIDINGGKLSVRPGPDQNVCGANATVSVLSNVSLTGTTEGGEKVTLTEGTYGPTELNQFKSFVTKESATVKTEPTAKSLTENGSAQQLVTAGEAENGTMQYALGKDATTVPTSGWGEAIPTGTNAETYYVWYKAKGDDTHGDSLPVCVTVRIANQGGGSSGGGSAAETAQQVADKINALPDVSALTLKDADAVAAVLAEYNKLSEEDKAKVSQETLKKLRDAEAKIAELKKADEDQKAAGEVSKQIEALPADPAKAGEADAQAAFDAFMKLTDAQKALLSDDAKQKVAAYKFYYEVKYAEAQKVKMSSAKAKKGGKAVVKWKKNKAADGYRLYYKAKGVKAKKVNIKSSKTVKTTVKKLKDGKVYSFKVRSYTKVNDPSTGKTKNVYGKWSKAKKVRAK